MEKSVFVPPSSHSEAVIRLLDSGRAPTKFYHIG